ncbi:MAG: winged helix-turn-helix domain-containing protein [Rhodobacter sp.]|nr:winged helix-turn-helix domain-containing protein [Rhodobacter sp.]MCA3493859.1 winged helix-turn-helix domain-containing protein [Rhodobacter sp.]MCA3499514.1 winged helix-turn-helix domain-containing protein [Rhodobacter sp.]MCA3502780.1 winged helix-turn-helix domain-containing protein [Rhodobacter sp.]MCA3515941.1 winged helix-turn-helix domain-containing protein [Rhodobacter sp.]
MLRPTRWHFRRADLQRRIKARFGVTLHGRTVGRQLAAPGFCRFSLRPQHPESDAGGRRTRSKELCRNRS